MADHPHGLRPWPSIQAPSESPESHTVPREVQELVEEPGVDSGDSYGLSLGPACIALLWMLREPWVSSAS